MYGIVLNLCRYHWRLTEYRRSLVVTFFLTALVYLVAVAELLARDEPNANQYLSVLLVVASFFIFSCLTLAVHLVPLTICSLKSTNLISTTLVSELSVWIAQLAATLILVVSQFLIFAPLFVLQFQHISWLDILELGAIFISGSLWLQVIGLVMSEHIYQRIFPRKSPKMFILGIIISLIVLPAISPVSWSRLLSPIYVLVRSLIDVSHETGLTSSAIGLYIIGYFLFSLVHFFLKEVP